MVGRLRNTRLFEKQIEKIKKKPPQDLGNKNKFYSYPHEEQCDFFCIFMKVARKATTINYFSLI